MSAEIFIEIIQKSGLSVVTMITVVLYYFCRTTNNCKMPSLVKKFDDYREKMSSGILGRVENRGTKNPE